LLAALPACGSSGSSSSTSTASGLASESPAAILAAVSGATKDLRTVHISGSTSTSGKPMSLDLSLAAHGGAKGSMSLGAIGFRIIAIGNTVYFSGSNSFWSRFAGPAASLFAGKWLKAPESGRFAPFARLTNLGQLFAQFRLGHSSLTKGAVTTVNGQRVIPLTDTAKGGTMYVATTGPPYPVEISKPGADGGHFYFSQFNRPVTLTPPSNAIDISALG
jgi:hypothetical protein